MSEETLVALDNRDMELMKQFCQGDLPNKRGVVLKPKKFAKTQKTSRSKAGTSTKQVSGKEAALPRGDRD